jgi:Mitofissin
MLGRLVHYTFDAVLVSTVVAGVRRSSGFESVESRHDWNLSNLNSPVRPQTALIPEATVRSVAESFLGVGETVFDVIQATAVNSSYWRRSSK